MSNQYLYEELDVLNEFGYLKELPEYITINLNENIVIREYQEEAFRYFITYYESPELRKNKQVHNLFHMATGSGKTVMMAGLILYLYMQAKDLYDGTMKIFKEISLYLQKIETEYEGTKEFYAKRVYEVLKDKKIYIDNPHGDGVGVSPSMIANEDVMDLSYEQWYVYNDNYGTSEEKAFVKHFKGIVKDLISIYDEIYLVRNERIPALAIYEFDTGERFEPDFLLFLQKKGTDDICKNRFTLSQREVIY